MTNDDNQYDVLVVGAGIAGGETALNLANLGHTVLLIEKDLSVGGNMIHLSKVFPTLDCGACITTPKFSEIDRHKNIKTLTSTEASNIVKQEDGSFSATITTQPRYVNIEDCKSCPHCEEACPVTVEDEYQYGLVGRKAAFIPFSICSPKVAAIDMENCTLCGACEKACPADCIDFTHTVQEYSIACKTVIIATGFSLFNPYLLPNYGFGKYKNVITSMQMERQLVPTRPFNSILRPSDGKMPDNIAYILCAGSRDKSVGNPICSQICCMYSIKQAQLLMGALPLADVSLYYLHIRAFGKGFNEFYQQGVSMGVEFHKGKIAKITELENGNLLLRYEDFETGKVTEAEHDMVVLSLGVMPNLGVKELFTNQDLELDSYNYVSQADLLVTPAMTSIDGVYVAGVASAPMDIPDTILSGGGASAAAANYIAKVAQKEVQV